MDGLKDLGFLYVMRESISVSFRGWKLMAIIAITSMILSSVSYLVFISALMPLLRDLFVQEASLLMAATSGQDASETFQRFTGFINIFGILFATEYAFALASNVISFVTAVLTTSASSICYTSKTPFSSLKELLLRPVGSWIRPFITSFHLGLLITGYFFSVICASALLLPFPQIVMLRKSLIFVFGGVALVLFIYLSVVWKLAFTVSVVEENCYGNQALGRAEGLVEGKRLDGFIIEFLFTIVYGVTLGLVVLKVKISGGDTGMMVYLLMVNCFCLLRMLQSVVYAVLYFHCRKSHGDEIELRESVEYNKISCDYIP